MSTRKEIHIEEIDECSFEDNPSTSSKLSSKLGPILRRPRAQKLLSSITNVSHIFRRKSSQIETTSVDDSFNQSNMSRENNTTNHIRPVSMYCPQQYEPSNEEILHNNLSYAQVKLLESDRRISNLEMKIETLESEIETLREQNDELKNREKSHLSQIREYEIREQRNHAKQQEDSLQSRIREMELTSELAVLSQQLGTLETRKEEKRVEKIMEEQSRFMEQTLPYTDLDMVYDNEDGLFNGSVLDEYLKEQNLKPVMNDKSSLNEHNNGSWMNTDDLLILHNSDN